MDSPQTKNKSKGKVIVQRSVRTFTATIYVGLRVGRTADPNPRYHTVDEVTFLCRAYCDAMGLCVTVTPTTFIYKMGIEPGVAVGLINYPRFPAFFDDIKANAIHLAELLKVNLEQMVVSIVCPDETIMLADELVPLAQPLN